MVLGLEFWTKSDVCPYRSLIIRIAYWISYRFAKGESRRDRLWKATHNLGSRSSSNQCESVKSIPYSNSEPVTQSLKLEGLTDMVG